MTRKLPNGDLIDFWKNRIWINGIDQGEMPEQEVKRLYNISEEY